MAKVLNWLQKNSLYLLIIISAVTFSLIFMTEYGTYSKLVSLRRHEVWTIIFAIISGIPIILSLLLCFKKSRFLTTINYLLLFFTQTQIFSSGFSAISLRNTIGASTNIGYGTVLACILFVITMGLFLMNLFYKPKNEESNKEEGQ